MQKEILMITGGTSGLGLEIVRQALEKGLYVCNLARNEQKMKELDATFKENYKGFIGDIADENFIRSSIDEISKIGNIKYLVNNAQKSCFKKPTDYTSLDIDISFGGLKGMILCTSKVLEVKKEQDLKIVNIMSSAALKGNKQESLYCATKWGERGYTESLKTEYKGTTVKVIGVYPGGMDTNFWKDNREYVSSEKSDTFMNPKEVATVILDAMLNHLNVNIADITIERN